MSNKRQRRNQASNCKDIGKEEPICKNCGQRGAHFVPPSFGEPGFYACEKKEPVNADT